MKITKDLKIGITAHNAKLAEIWSNGLRQNAFHLRNLLLEAGYENTKFVCENREKSKDGFCGIEVDFITHDNIAEYDIIFEVCNAISNNIYKSFKKNPKNALVNVQYGNDYMIGVERSIYVPNDKVKDTKTPRDEMWTSPHYEFAKVPLEIMHRTEVKICPYIWSPYFLEQAYDIKDLLYHPGNYTSNKLGVLESNLYTIKTCHIPILIIEDLYKRNPNAFEHAYIFSTNNIKNNNNFVSFCKDLYSVKKGVTTFESRMGFPYILKNRYINAIISNQFYNDLNYLQLEAMYLGYPIIHNSKPFMEYGYYYEGLDAYTGSRQLEIALKTHKNTFLDKRAYERKKVYQYHPFNSKNIEGYAKLIEDLVEKRIKINNIS